MRTTYIYTTRSIIHKSVQDRFMHSNSNEMYYWNHANKYHNSQVMSNFTTIQLNQTTRIEHHQMGYTTHLTPFFLLNSTTVNIKQIFPMLTKCLNAIWNLILKSKQHKNKSKHVIPFHMGRFIHSIITFAWAAHKKKLALLVFAFNVNKIHFK